MEFAFILIVVCVLSFLLMKVTLKLKSHHIDDLEFNPDANQEQVELLDEN